MDAKEYKALKVVILASIIFIFLFNFKPIHSVSLLNYSVIVEFCLSAVKIHLYFNSKSFPNHVIQIIFVIIITYRHLFTKCEYL